MKFQRNLFISMCAIALVFVASPLSAGTLSGLFTAATKSNRDYSVYQLTLELAGLKRTKGEIEAKIEQDRVQAQYDYSGAVSTYWSNVLNFFSKVVNAIFDAGSASTSYQSCLLSLQNAKDDMDSAEVRYKNGLISEDTYKELAISYNTAKTNLQLAESTMNYAQSYVKFVTGLEWTADLLPGIPAFESKASLDDWVAKDSALEKARLYQKLNTLKTEALATNTSMYDRRIQETENAKAAAEVSNAEDSAKRSYDEILSTLENDASVMKIRQDEYSLKMSIYQQAQEQYQKGTISLSTKNAKQIDVFSAQEHLLSAQKDYINSMASYQTSMREDPLGL